MTTQPQPQTEAECPFCKAPRLLGRDASFFACGTGTPSGGPSEGQFKRSPNCEVKTQPQTETPETDAAIGIVSSYRDEYGENHEGPSWVPADFARDLERRLRALETERDDLARWKREALEVAIQLQEQEIGREIGVGLGKHISPEILPWIREQKKKLKALETAAEGMEMALGKIAPSNDFLDCPCDNDGRWNCPCFNIAQQALAAYRALLPPTEK